MEVGNDFGLHLEGGVVAAGLVANPRDMLRLPFSSCADCGQG